MDIAIKLFAIAQARAIYDGSETVTAALIEAVAQKELAAVMPMIEALRRDDLQSLEAYRDLAPVGLDALLSGVRSNFSGRRVRGLAIGGEHPLFKEEVTEVLTSVGFEATDAQALADDASDAPNLLKGIEKALKQATSGKPAPKLRNKGVHQAEPANYLPGDYRNATNPEAEGIETALAASELCEVPVWSCISTTGIESFEPPEGAEHIVIFADNDENFAGQAAAYRAAHRLSLRGIEVEVVTPPAAGNCLDHLIQTKLRVGSASD